jgi:hypothetical protein
LLQSEDFSTTWAATNATVSTNATTDPLGGTTADQILESASGSAQRYVEQSITHTDSVDLVLSVYAKQGTNVDHVALQLLYDQPTNSTGYIFDLANGAPTQLISSVAQPNAVGMYNVGNGWYRCFISVTPNDATTTAFIYQTNDATDVTYTGNGSEGIYLWGAMIEEGRFYPGGYIASAASSGTSTEHETVPITPNSRTGIADFRDEARYHKIKVKVSGGFTTIMGADVEFTPAGKV